MDLAALWKLRDHERRKVVLRDAAGEIIGMVVLQEPASTGSLDEAQRSLNESDEMRQRFGRRLTIADATAAEIAAFDASRLRIN